MDSAFSGRHHEIFITGVLLLITYPNYRWSRSESNVLLMLIIVWWFLFGISLRFRKFSSRVWFVVVHHFVIHTHWGAFFVSKLFNAGNMTISTAPDPTFIVVKKMTTLSVWLVKKGPKRPNYFRFLFLWLWFLKGQKEPNDQSRIIFWLTLICEGQKGPNDQSRFFSGWLWFVRDKWDKMAKADFFSCWLWFVRDKREQMAKADFFCLTLICEGQKGPNGQSRFFLVDFDLWGTKGTKWPKQKFFLVDSYFWGTKETK